MAALPPRVQRRGLLDRRPVANANVPAGALATRVSSPIHKSLSALTLHDPILDAFERLVRRDPLAPLVVTPERRATVGDVDALARAAGGLLAAWRLAPGTLVGLAAAGWLSGQTPEECAARAATAYAANQKISRKAAAGVFATE